MSQPDESARCNLLPNADNETCLTQGVGRDRACGHCLVVGWGDQAPPKAEIDRLPEPHVEWAVEVTWRDWKKAGAKGPTSQYGPFDKREAADHFLDQQRRDRDVAATRVFERLAAYTVWDSTEEPEPTSEADRNLRLASYYDRMADEMGLHPHARVTSPAGSES